MKKMLSLLLPTLLFFTACASPESLLSNSEEEVQLEKMSVALRLGDATAQLESYALTKVAELDCISLTFQLVATEEATEIDVQQFSLAAMQNKEALQLQAVPTEVTAGKALVYTYQLLNQEEPVLFEFTYGEGDAAVTKHYEIFLQ
ncbi:hypothetical protein M2139_002691 [Enterococcus sp. PF1-24]|uniref:hypothetical protein n=1 Tax=unclassified Enterococcus TaxID=2608891 RepID=UPI00247467DF|nr:MULTISPECIES: hypothetical protein [unclassified Enterococcus]MDH6365689.1 hypothetical protein [Enterococcus sp. PFB1-1]MDH6402785.1 hypothetical protein [Enterococcus sp. PF1-24]